MATKRDPPLSGKVAGEHAHAQLGRQLLLIRSEVAQWNKISAKAIDLAISYGSANLDDQDDFLIVRRQLGATLDMLFLLHSSKCFSLNELAKRLHCFACDFNAYAREIRERYSTYY